MYKSVALILSLFLFSHTYAELPCSYESDLQDDILQIKQLEQELAERRELLRTRKRLQRNRDEQLKQQQREKNRRLRLQQKCEKVTQQITLVNQRLRTGYTIEQGKVLNRKLAEYKEEKRKVCKHE